MIETFGEETQTERLSIDTGAAGLLADPSRLEGTAAESD
jgi:hypothetical protein